MIVMLQRKGKINNQKNRNVKKNRNFACKTRRKKMIERELQQKTSAHKYPFRLYDADGELYYKGLSIETNSFEPLDEEQPNSGVTEIHYFIDGKWEEL